MTEKTLNVEEAKELFSRESVAFEYSSGVPLKAAAKLLGEDAVIFAMNRTNPMEKWGSTYGQYGIGEIQMPYLTERGFMVAVTYRNIELLHYGSRPATA